VEVEGLSADMSDFSASPSTTVSDDRPPQPERRLARRVIAAVATTLAIVVVWFALVAPNRTSDLSINAFLRIPVEGLAGAALLLVLPWRARRPVAVVLGVVLAALTILKILDMGFYSALDRPFNPVSDWSYFDSAIEVLSDSVGHTAAVTTAILLMIVAAALLALMPLAVIRLMRIVTAHHTRSARAIVGAAMVWVLCAVFGVQIASGAPIASSSAAQLVYDQARGVSAAVKDRETFEKLADVDAFRDAPPESMLRGLRGKDVIFAFVESYGRVATEGSAFSPQVDAVLDRGTKRLQAAGYSSKSAFLTSPTFGGISWLAHSTLQSGLWVDTQQRYDQLMDIDRLTLASAFGAAGWRTVADVPSNDRDWSEGTSFYGYDQIYDRRNVGYEGPTFSYASMPDQYTLAALQRLELGRPDRDPLMAEIDLVSSHTPWAPLPHMVDWPDVGDGSIFDPMPAEGQSPDELWKDSDQVKAAYGQSIEYSLEALISFVETYGDKNLVMVVLGDHQPSTTVSGENASHDVPITVIAHDPAVMDRISDWGWQDGMRPDPQAPVWPMDTFRDRFFTAYQ
jgi:hypothetical protein